MRNGGDYDDAVNVIDVWLQEHPQTAPWERDDFDSHLDSNLDADGLIKLEKPKAASRYEYV